MQVKNEECECILSDFVVVRRIKWLSKYLLIILLRESGTSNLLRQSSGKPCIKSRTTKMRFFLVNLVFSVSNNIISHIVQIWRMLNGGSRIVFSSDSIYLKRLSLLWWKNKSVRDIKRAKHQIQTKHMSRSHLTQSVSLIIGETSDQTTRSPVTT